MMLTDTLFESIIELVERVALEALSVGRIRDNGELVHWECTGL